MAKKTLSKSDLVDAVHKTSEGLSKKQVGAVVDSVLDSIVSTVSKGNEISVVGFGKFAASKRAARTGRNPATGEELKIPATVVPKFTPGKAFKEAVGAKGSKKGKK